MTRYRKKPCEIDAEIYSEGMEDGFDERWRDADNPNSTYGIPISDDDEAVMVPYIDSLEGHMLITKGDYIITGIKGERYPCKPDIFEQTYERVHPIRHCMVCPSTDDVKRYKTKHNGSFCPNGGDGYVQYCKKHAKHHGYTDEHLHSTHR